jgi:magnesium chelatase family protein
VLDDAAPLSAEARLHLRHELESQRLSGRGYHRIRRVARTIGDTADDPPHLVGLAEVVLALRMRASLAGGQQHWRVA